MTISMMTGVVKTCLAAGGQIGVHVNSPEVTMTLLYAIMERSRRRIYVSARRSPIAQAAPSISPSSTTWRTFRTIPRRLTNLKVVKPSPSPEIVECHVSSVGRLLENSRRDCSRAKVLETILEVCHHP
ncbi:Uncharacterized protein Rs2_28974 [Raphanus sativus]|nr:Uncharacterized protein Rs2_28974 [Raphanus sativus]